MLIIIKPAIIPAQVAVIVSKLKLKILGRTEKNSQRTIPGIPSVISMRIIFISIFATIDSP